MALIFRADVNLSDNNKQVDIDEVVIVFPNRDKEQRWWSVRTLSTEQYVDGEFFSLVPLFIYCFVDVFLLFIERYCATPPQRFLVVLLYFMSCSHP